MTSRTSLKARYEKIKHLGEGQFANVYKAKDLETDEFVAIKKIKLGSRYEAKDGVNRTALREIKLLQELHHVNIIGLLNVIGHKTNIQLVFDFMETDLENLVKDTTIILMPEHIKNIVLQVLLGLEHLHLHWVLHRLILIETSETQSRWFVLQAADLKPNNLLMNSHGRIKITDFGLARFFGSPNRNYTHQVVTRWYRAPELLYAARSYGVGVDMWAIGCIIAELLLRNPIFPGESDLDQLAKIYAVLGTPTVEEWELMTDLPDYVQMRPMVGIPLKNVFTAASDDLIELIYQCLRFDPLKRWNATQALHSYYFQAMPYACDDADLPMPASARKIAAKKRRRFPDGSTPPISRKRLTFHE